MINITVPISRQDVHLLPDFVSVLEKFGGLQNHRVTLVPQLSQTPEANEAFARIAKLTTNVSVVAMSGDLVADNWPMSPNAQFLFAAQKMAAFGVPWFWMELDTLPRLDGWIDALEREYHAKEKAFLGNIVDTPYLKEGGGVVTIPGDQMMMGVAIYHHHLFTADRLIDDLGKNATEPFDVYLRWVFKNLGYANSEVLCDMWNTCNYRMAGNDLVCDSAPMDKPHRPRGGVVPASAYIVHGCKDGSLAKLLLGEPPNYDGGKQAAERVIEDLRDPSVDTITTSSGVFVDRTHTSEADRWWSDQSEQAKEWIRDYCIKNGNPGPAGTDGKESIIPEPKTLFTAKPFKKSSAPELTVANVITKLKSQKMRYAALAEFFRTDLVDMKDWLITNGFEIKKAGWVGLSK